MNEVSVGPSSPCGLVSPLCCVLPAPRLGPLAAHLPGTAAGKGAPRRSDGGARRPGQPPRQDQTWQSPRSRPGTGRGNWQAGAALPGGGEGGTAAARTRGQQQPPTRGRSDSVGAAGPGRQPEEGGPGAAPRTRERGPPTTGALDPGLGLSGPRQPPAWENPGLLPGAAALAGQSGGGDSRNLPGDRGRVTGQNPPIYGQRFRCVSRESPGARDWVGPRLRTAGRAPGRLPAGAGRLDRVLAPHCPPPGSGPGSRGAWAEPAR